MIIKHPFPTPPPPDHLNCLEDTRQNNSALKPVLLGVRGRVFQASHVLDKNLISEYDYMF